MLKIFFLAAIIPFSLLGMDAKVYEANSSLQQNIADDFLKKFNQTPGFKNYKDILDIGCGTGRNAAKMKELSPEALVDGIDINQQMIDHANDTYKVQGLTFRQMDAQNLDASKKRDLVTCFFTAQYIEKQKELFRCIAEMLVENGKFLITMSGKIDKEDCRLQALEKLKNDQTWEDVFKGKTIADQHYDQSEHELRAKLEAVGLKIDKLFAITAEKRVETIQQVEDYINGWIGFFDMMKPLSQEQRKQFVHDWVENFKDCLPRRNGLIIYKIPLLIAQASKVTEQK